MKKVSITAISTGSIMTIVVVCAFFAFNTLISVLWGFFIGGTALTLVAMFMIGVSMSQSEPDADGAEPDADGDIDADSDVDIDADGDVDAGSGAMTDLDTAISGFSVASSFDSPDAALTSDKGQNAPFLMLVAGYLMFVGILGIIFIDTWLLNSWVFLGIALLPPLALNQLVQWGWKRITRSETYVIPSGLPLVGQRVRVSIPVDESGGVVKIDASNVPLGYQRVPVLPLNPESKYFTGDVVYMCGTTMKNGKEYYVVSHDVNDVKKKKKHSYLRTEPISP